MYLLDTGDCFRAVCWAGDCLLSFLRIGLFARMAQAGDCCFSFLGIGLFAKMGG